MEQENISLLNLQQLSKAVPNASSAVKGRGDGGKQTSVPITETYCLNQIKKNQHLSFRKQKLLSLFAIFIKTNCLNDSTIAAFL